MRGSTMIWYVATLIASVISTRGLVAQGELKCSIPPPTHLASSDLCSRLWLPNPEGEAPAPASARRTSEHWPGRGLGNCGWEELGGKVREPLG